MSQELTPEEWQKELQWATENGHEDYAKEVRAVLGQEAGPARPEPAPEPSFLDNWGRPIAEAGGSLIGGALGLPGNIPGIMTGAAAGGHAGGMAWDYLTGSPAPSPQEQVTSAAFNTMGGPDPARRVAPALLAGKVPEGGLFDIGRGGSVSVADDLTRGADEAADQRVSDVVEEGGGRWTAANRGSPLAQRAEAVSEASPFSVDIWTKHHERGKGILDDLFQETFPQHASRQVAGERASLGFGEVVGRAENMIDGMYENLDMILARGSREGAQTPVDMNALGKLADEYDRVVQSGGEFGEMVFQDPDLKRAVDAIKAVREGQGPPYDIVKQLRTIIGRKVGEKFGRTGEAVGQKRLYGALSEDLVNAREAIGGRSAKMAGERADAAFKGLQTTLSELDPVFKNTENPTQVYEAFSRAVQNRPLLAAKVKEVLPPDDWNQLVDTYMYRLSRAKPGAQSIDGDAISPRTLVTNLAKLKQDSPEGYKLLVNDRREALDVIERMAQGLTGAETYLNRSQTAGTLQGMQFLQEVGTGSAGALGGLLTGQGGTGAAVGALAAVAARPLFSRMYAKALTSPTFAKALEKVGKSRDVLPTGMELARALIAAGADKQEVEAMFGEEQ